MTNVGIRKTTAGFLYALLNEIHTGEIGARRAKVAKGDQPIAAAAADLEHAAIRKRNHFRVA